MTIMPLYTKLNINNAPSFKEKEVKKSYLEAKGAIDTQNNIKPLPPKGHLIHDNAANSVKYFFKDRAYDLKSVKNGYLGVANDHQSGRLNDVGLVTAGVLIASYLASKTTDPKVKAMEYVGLGAFLAAMSIYPKLAINAPAKMLHGFDIDKQYIDDQGRKKSVMQDANYVPYDMYLGEVPEEDFAKIGDEMGIPRDIKNRNDVIREQMRKNATQSQTLWMLTAAVTPALGALISYGLENYAIAPGLEKYRSAKFNKLISKALDNTTKMSDDLASIKSNSLSNNIEHLISRYRGKNIPKQEINNLVKILTENLDANASEGIKDDLMKIFRKSANGMESFVIQKESINEMFNVAKISLNGRNSDVLEKILVPTKEEIDSVLKSIVKDFNADLGTTINSDEISKIKDALKSIIDTKIQNSVGINKDFLHSEKNNVLKNITKVLQTEKSTILSEENFKQIIDFSKVLGEFKNNQKVIDKCKSFKFEQTQETVLARSYGKFESTLFDILGIKFKDLKKMRESEEYTRKILDKKFTELCQNEERYKKAFEKLGKVVSEMETKLHGSDEAKSHILDLINATENNYNNTAKRLAKLGSFEQTINRLVKEDVSTLANSVKSKQELFDLLDGIVENKFRTSVKDGKLAEYIKNVSSGVGSSKNLEIAKTIERYQGVKNSFNRILHTLDVYKRAQNPETFAESLYGKDKRYVNEIIKKAKDTLLKATASDHTLKLDTINNPEFYKDLMNSVWAGEAENFWSTKQKGIVSESVKEALGKYNSPQKGNVLDRFQFYITRFRNLIGNNSIDFTKPRHKLHNGILEYYTQAERTRSSMFNLVAQPPIDLAKGAAGRRYASQKWLRIIAPITAGVFGIAILAQFGFGKLSNPQNLQKQVNNDTSK